MFPDIEIAQSFCGLGHRPVACSSHTPGSGVYGLRGRPPACGLSSPGAPLPAAEFQLPSRHHLGQILLLVRQSWKAPCLASRSAGLLYWCQQSVPGSSARERDWNGRAASATQGCRCQRVASGPCERRPPRPQALTGCRRWAVGAAPCREDPGAAQMGAEQDPHPGDSCAGLGVSGHMDRARDSEPCRW